MAFEIINMWMGTGLGVLSILFELGKYIFMCL